MSETGSDLILTPFRLANTLLAHRLTLLLVDPP